MRRTKSGLPKHCGWNVDRHDKRRVRFRKRGFTTYLTGIPWSEDFMRQYAAALEGVDARKANIGADRWPSASAGALVAAYLDCGPFKAKSPATQRMRRNVLDRFRAEWGQSPLFQTDKRGSRIMLLNRHHLQTMVNKKAATPFAQRNFLKTLRVMFKWAVDEGRVPENPALGVTWERAKSSGWRTWTEEEILRFENHHKVGSKARLAFALLLYTGQRRGDVIRMGEWMIRSGEHGEGFVLTQEKTKKTNPPITVPVHPKLREIIDATPMVGVKTFIVTQFGKPYKAAGFGNWFREKCDEAECPVVSAHGLRKATGKRLAEIGCGDKEIAAILGQRSSAVVNIYTRDADQELLARSAMRKLIEAGK